MVKSVAKTNQKLVARLYSELDLKAVQSALNRGEITPRQAQNITKFIRAAKVRAAKAIRESARRGAVVFDEATSQYVGEVVSENGGALWTGAVTDGPTPKVDGMGDSRLSSRSDAA
jgi:hypothetical protein